MHEQEDDQLDGQILIGLPRRRDAQLGTVPYRWEEDDFCPDLVVSAAEHSARGTALLKLKGENVLGKPGDVDRSAIIHRDVDAVFVVGRQRDERDFFSARGGWTPARREFL
ncbi:hypothetical protein [Xanthomonas melonis]|uniref:hypothetical protein n=1 Tax=Xanthomonas melonis TaxID=56456 RepID=UPI001E5E5DAF|nr:hypothetical protein [Xanthomonas melonis]